jgi:hypothetical protein
MPHQELADTLFAGKTGNADLRSYLQKLCNEAPYFAIAQFFLLKETPVSDFNYRKVAAKTAVHFNNPLWLRRELGRKMVETGEMATVEDTPVTEEIIAAPAIPATEPVAETPVIQEETAPEPKTVMAEMQVAEPVAQEPLEAQQAAAEVVKKEKKDKEELLFEPLYTTDYFASQGIKLSEEIQSGDKLGKQLRSFTDWLKTMKKLHQGKIPESQSLDATVQKLAEKSNKEDEIITESMAEVFASQGKKDKAIDVYQKLSLLNPSKSAYFAAKIEFLKEN